MASVALRFRAVGGLEPGSFFAVAVLTGTFEPGVGSVGVAALAGVFDRVARVVAPEVVVVVVAAAVFGAFVFALPVPFDLDADTVSSSTSAGNSSFSLA